MSVFFIPKLKLNACWIDQQAYVPLDRYHNRGISNELMAALRGSIAN